MKQLDRRRYRATALLETIRDQGRSVVWFAGKMGMSRQYTNDLVRGRFTVRHEVAERAAGILGVPLFLLFEVSGGYSFDPAGNEAEAMSA